MGYPKGRPQSEESKAKRRAAMLARIAAGKWNGEKLQAGSRKPETQRKRFATALERGHIARRVAEMNASQSRPDVRAKLSAERKARYSTPEGREKLLATLTAGSQRPEVNERRKATSRAYALSSEGLENKRKAGVAALRALRGASANKKWEHAGVRFRSSWERDFARFLDVLGVRWEYEPEAFVLEDGRRYVPDFLVHVATGAVFVEIKGPRWRVEKFHAFVRGYPHKTAMLLGEEEIEAIRGSLN